MKKEKKFTIDKFQVAKLKNMKKIRGGLGDPNPTNDHEITDILRRLSSNVC
ncbi:hypothetical protein [Flavobacterium facile]|uniref:hypothetical protein n=1 Tax=Flavobacterium facile TaxID=2893174 RepID=UPI002E7A3BF4|nr:hypothetical protein [Flavobacterium sp. T-12]